MPLVGSCSAAISAACQRPPEDKEAHLLPVQWGVITPAGEDPARCSFTTLRTVEPPKEGELFLGSALHPIRPCGSLESYYGLVSRVHLSAVKPLKEKS